MAVSFAVDPYKNCCFVKIVSFVFTRSTLIKAVFFIFCPATEPT